MANDQVQKKVPVKIKTRVFRDSPEAFFRAGFERIANTRMKGVPILNPKLHVSSVPVQKSKRSVGWRALSRRGRFS